MNASIKRADRPDAWSRLAAIARGTETAKGRNDKAPTHFAAEAVDRWLNLDGERLAPFPGRKSVEMRRGRLETSAAAAVWDALGFRALLAAGSVAALVVALNFGTVRHGFAQEVPTLDPVGEELMNYDFDGEGEMLGGQAQGGRPSPGDTLPSLHHS